MNANDLSASEKYLRQLAFINAYKLMLSDEMSHKSNVDKIVFLSKLDFSADEIAEIINTTIGTVRKEISVYKSKQGSKDKDGKNASDK